MKSNKGNKKELSDIWLSLILNKIRATSEE